jgi:FKBP-type peptidyl-prolyl cis-trans isomerase
MIRIVTALVLGVLMVGSAAAQEEVPPAKKATAPPAAAAKAPRETLKTQKERSSYAIGLDIGRMLRTQGVDCDLLALHRGIEHALASTKPELSDAEIREAMQELAKEAQARREKTMKELSEKNKAEGKEFLAANAKKQGVKAAKSGLQYKVVKEGTGPSPKATDLVRTHYHGTFIDGQVFDSSVERGQPAVFPVNGVIAGWTEALQMMKVGSKWQLVVPPELAYGQNGSGDIPPNATLIFDVELLGIEKGDREPE